MLMQLKTFQKRIKENKKYIQRDFNEVFNLCLEYENTANKLIENRTIYKNVKIGGFISDKLNDYKKNKLSQDRLKMLMQLKTFQKRIKENKIHVVRNFNEVYNLCLEYENTTNKLIKSETIYKDIKIGRFIGHKITAYNKNKLSPDRIKLLIQLKTWQYRINNANKFID